jgi:hypothetical protein
LPRGASRENWAEGRGDNASDMDKCKCVADPVFFLQNGQYSAVPTADIIYRSDMEAAITSILQFLLPSGEAFTECDKTDARIELLPVWKDTFSIVPPGVSVLPINQWSKYQEAYKQMDRLYEQKSGKKCTFSVDAKRDIPLR